jgi:hypothetical protein
MELHEKKYFKIVRYKTKTGQILNDKGEFAFSGEGEQSKFFDKEEDAKQYIIKNIVPGQGFYIMNEKGKITYENIYDEVVVTGERTKKWWQFWR